MHSVEHGQLVETIGLELDGIACRVRLSAHKRWRLKWGVKAFLRRRLVCGSQLEVLLGHFTHAMLLRRCTLSCFQKAYVFISFLRSIESVCPVRSME